MKFEVEQLFTTVFKSFSNPGAFDLQGFSKQFEKFCQNMLDVMEQEFVIPFNIELQFPIRFNFDHIIKEMKRILSTFSEKVKSVKLIKYKQPQHIKSIDYIVSPTPIFGRTAGQNENQPGLATVKHFQELWTLVQINSVQILIKIIK